MHEEWRAHRSAMTKAFHVVDIKNMTAQFVTVANKLCAYLETVADTGHTVDMVPVLKAATLDIIGITAFGYNFGAIDGLYRGVSPPAAAAFQFLMTELRRRSFSANPLLQLYWTPTAANAKHAECRKLLRGIIDDIVRTRVTESTSTSGPAQHEDLLQHMLRAREADADARAGGHITEESLTDSLLTLLFGGYDTTSLALSFALWLLHTSPSVNKRLLAELDAQLPADPLQITDTVVGNLKFARAVFEETLRLYPPAPITARTLTANVTLCDGTQLPSGTQVEIPISIIQRDPENWPDEPGAVTVYTFVVCFLWVVCVI